MIISRLTDLLYFLFFFFFQHGAQLIKTPFNAIIKGKTVKKKFRRSCQKWQKKEKEMENVTGYSENAWRGSDPPKPIEHYKASFHFFLSITA